MTRVAHALADPLPHLPARRPGSLRRTSHLDVGATADGSLVLTGVAHDPSGTVTCRADLGADRTLRTLELTPEGTVGDTAGLVGLVVGRGFRAAVDERCAPGSLVSVLLCDLPVVALLSGYGSLYSGLLATPLTDQFIGGLPVDVCAGWAGSSSMVRHIRDRREIPTPDGPVAPADAEGWHRLPALGPGVLRRQRLIERAGDEVWAMFRDAYGRPDGVVAVLHEYIVTATVATDPGGGGGGGDERVTACTATPRVLPWAECPRAAGSAARLVGRPVAGLRRLVRDDLVGTSTCTHLNDLLSSLSQAGELV